MRSLLKVLSKIAITSAIADMAVESSMSDEAKAMYQRMDEAATTALRAFPGQLSSNEILLLRNKMTEFCDRMGLDRQKRHIHSFLIFSTELLEQVRRELVEHYADPERIKAIDNLIQIEAEIYEHFADREYALCNLSGMKAAEVWREVWGKE